MNRKVLSIILTADEVCELPEGILELLPDISTGIVLDSINKFVENNINSSDLICREAAVRLERAYKQVNETNAYLSSDEAKHLAETLATLQYSDISATTDLDTLKQYRRLIIELLVDDEEFMSTYKGSVEGTSANKKMAYTAKLDTDNLTNVLEQMTVYASGNVVAQNVVKKIRQNKSLFKNGKNCINQATVLRKAIYKKDKLKTILRGLDYLIPKLEARQSPVSWRRV